MTHMNIVSYGPKEGTKTIKMRDETLVFSDNESCFVGQNTVNYRFAKYSRLGSCGENHLGVCHKDRSLDPGSGAQ